MQNILVMLPGLKPTVMKRSTKDKVRMFGAVQLVMTKYHDAWSGNLGFELGVEQYNLLLENLRSVSAKHSVAHAGTKTLKNTYMGDLISKAIIVRNGLEVFAFDSNMPRIYESIRFTEAGLENSSQQVLRERLARIYELASEFENELVQYGVTSNHILDFLGLYEQFENEIASLRVGIIERKLLTNRMYTIEKDIMILMKRKIDVLMKLVAIEHPDFFEEYKNARLVIEKSNSKSKDLPPKGEEDIGKAS